MALTSSTNADPLLLHPPADATRYELARDATLAFLSRRCFFWIAIALIPAVLGFGATWFFLIIGVPAPLSPEERGWWQNTSIQILVTIMVYAAIISLPWRAANAIHLWGSHRSSAVGHDLYGRPTDDIWFHIPRPHRGAITVLLLGNCVSQYINRAARCVYPDYESASKMPGRFWTLAFLLLAFALQGAAGVYKAVRERRLRTVQPGRFGPSPVERAAQWWRQRQQRRRGGRELDDVDVVVAAPASQAAAAATTATRFTFPFGAKWRYLAPTLLL